MQPTRPAVSVKLSPDSDDHQAEVPRAVRTAAAVPGHGPAGSPTYPPGEGLLFPCSVELWRIAELRPVADRFGQLLP